MLVLILSSRKQLTTVNTYSATLCYISVFPLSTLQHAAVKQEAKLLL